MSIFQLTLAVICVAAICAGQILFKQVGVEIEAAGTWLHLRVLTFLGVACFIYGMATLLWIHLLRTVELNRVYPFMALSFVIVPLLSWLVFSERITGGYLLGAALITAGIVVITLGS